MKNFLKQKKVDKLCEILIASTEVLDVRCSIEELKRATKGQQ